MPPRDENGDVVSHVRTRAVELYTMPTSRRQKSECDVSRPSTCVMGADLPGPMENICVSADRTVKPALFRVGCM